jgi:hypothetical protein
MPRYKRVNLDYWWITPNEIENPEQSGLVPSSLARKDGVFGEARGSVWAWYRSEVAGNKKLSISARFVGWALCERWRIETWSSHDAVSYYAKMTGVNRKSVGKAIAELSEAELIWIVLEDKKFKRLRKSQAGGKKHFLLVGLSGWIEG